MKQFFNTRWCDQEFGLADIMVIIDVFTAVLKQRINLMNYVSK